jgi:hypothetical protein
VPAGRDIAVIQKWRTDGGFRHKDETLVSLARRTDQAALLAAQGAVVHEPLCRNDLQSGMSPSKGAAPSSARTGVAPSRRSTSGSALDGAVACRRREKALRGRLGPQKSLSTSTWVLPLRLDYSAWEDIERVHQ